MKDIAARLRAASTGGRLRFSLCAGEGWVTTSKEETIRLLCDLWNNRLALADALDAAALADHQGN